MKLIDPRFYQLIVLSALLCYGIYWLNFEVTGYQIAIILGTALLTQYISILCFKIPYFDPRSPLISGLSLCLLLRSHTLVFIVLTTIITIVSKFILRWQHKHLFNPTNFGLVSMLLLTDHIWVSPGQWGETTFFAFLIACLGSLVIYRAERSDVTYAFLLFYTSLLFGRALWLGDPLAIPLHQLENGALLLFTFFMISDPKTTPDSRTGRIFFAFLVAMGAGWVQFYLYRPNGLLWSLAFWALFIPIIDSIFPGKHYQWLKTNTR